MKISINFVPKIKKWFINQACPHKLFILITQNQEKKPYICTL